MDECSLVAQEALPLNLLKSTSGMPCASDGTVQFVQISVMLLPLADYRQLRPQNMHINNEPAQHGTQKVTARTTSYNCKADIQSDDASLARK